MFSKLKTAFGKSASKFSENIKSIFSSSKLDDDSLALLEKNLIMADIDQTIAATLCKKLRRYPLPANYSVADIKLALADIMTKSISVAGNKFSVGRAEFNVVLLCGVNGNGKTTTAGKLAHLYSKQGYKCAIAACDTYRAAAKDQLKIWAERSGAEFFGGDENSRDAASIAYSAARRCKDEGFDLLVIDTAGRLQNQQNLMDELKKIIKVVKKIDPDCLKYSLLTLDATTGRNATSQVDAFRSCADINGMVVTKLDGSAKAGSIINISNKFDMPVYFTCHGEGAGDIEAFNPQDFIDGLLEIERG